MKDAPEDHYSSEENARRYHEYWRKAKFTEESVKRGRERFEMFCSLVRPGGRILDAGCGTGRLDRYFHSRGFDVVGIDSSPEMLRIALEENPELTYRVMDIKDLEFEDESFDGVWTSGVLLHLPKKALHGTFQEFGRILRKDGALFISTRTAKTDNHKVEEASEGGDIESYYHSVETLLNGLADTRFEFIWHSIEPDDSGRQFSYIHILCKKN